MGERKAPPPEGAPGWMRQNYDRDRHDRGDGERVMPEPPNTPKPERRFNWSFTKKDARGD